MADGVPAANPEELLRGALEKIVFFECRLSQLEAELEAAQAAAAREKESASASRAREVELEKRLAQARSDVADAARRSSELGERVRLLEAERERLLAGLVERARVAGAPGAAGEVAGEEADLAGFIAELRGEIERLGRWKAAAERAGIAVDEGMPPAAPAPPAPVGALAAGFEAAGRLGLSAAEAERMRQELPTRAERALYQTSMDDLASADPGRRRRAADCLRSLGSRAAAALVAAALGRERHPEVKAALLGALGALAEPAAAEVAARELGDARPPVRAAALEALAALGKDGAEPALRGALADPSPAVRRRAALLLGFVGGPARDDALAGALGDRDPGVARAAALALSGRPTVRAQGALARALDHPEPAVRRAAAAAVGRWAEEEVDAAAPPAERRRAARRIAEKLAEMGDGELRRAVARGAADRAPLRDEAAAGGVGAGGAAHAPDLEAAIVGEVRASLRGRTAEELAPMAADRAALESTLRSLVARGRLARRGARFFTS